MKSMVACVGVVSSLSLAPIAFAEEETSTAPLASETAGPGVVASIAVGGTMQRLIDVPVAGFEGIGTFGGRVVGAQGTFLAGRTQYGLDYERGTFGLVIGSRAGAWGFGVSPYIGYLSISRDTILGDPLRGATLGISVQASWDFVNWHRSALFALVRLTGEIGALPILGAGLAVGYRFGP